jgi:hypothetical protein
MRITRVLFAVTAVLVCLVMVLHAFSYYALSPCPSENAPSLAEFDTRGFVRPFGKLNFDRRDTWLLEFGWPSGRKVSTNSLLMMNILKSVKFSCTGGDKGAGDLGFRISRNGTEVYTADVVEGSIQGRDFGLIEPVGVYLLVFLFSVYVAPDFL